MTTGNGYIPITPFDSSCIGNMRRNEPLPCLFAFLFILVVIASIIIIVDKLISVTKWWCRESSRRDELLRRDESSISQ